MGAWSDEKRQAFETAFYAFLDNCFINSKNKGFVSLGANLYRGQRMFITATLDGLQEDKHDIYCLKSRQLGLSTIARAASVFYIGVHRGLKGSLVFDTASNKEEARAELETMIQDIPARLKFPTVKKSNREGLTLVNNSKILFKHAGIKKSASSGTLGRSVGLALSHASEICSFQDVEGMISYRRSLSDSNPERLYIWESTARGWGLWKDMWDDARADTDHNVCVFLGWWTHDEQMIARGSKDWEKYGPAPPTEKEAEKIALVKKLYDYQVTQEQLAWYRRLIDPTAGGTAEGFTEDDNAYKLQEDPWTEDESFQQAGSIFFPPEVLTDISVRDVSKNYKGYMFMPGNEFVDMKIVNAPNPRNTDLKVWEEPVADGVYEVGVDPAHGENEKNDRSSIQVLRCYADGIDQVAEYAYPLVNTHQFAWVLASILGWYGSGANAQVKYALELNGPGTAVFNELRSLRHRVESGYRAKEIEERGLKDVFRNVRSYIYSRPDAMGAGHNYHIKTNQNLKITYLEGFRSFVANGLLRLRSAALVEEMKWVARDGDSIAAPESKKDDRVLAAAFASHSWDTGVRRQLVTQRRTREAEAARKRLNIVDQVSLFHKNQLQAMFDQKRHVRVAQQRLAMRQTWRYR